MTKRVLILCLALLLCLGLLPLSGALASEAEELPSQEAPAETTVPEVPVPMIPVGDTAVKSPAVLTGEEENPTPPETAAPAELPAVILPAAEEAPAPAKDGAGESLAVSAANFPDEVFRAWVLSNADTDGDGALSVDEREAVTEIDVSGSGIYDLTGLGHFPNLLRLDCIDNPLSFLDLSNNRLLTKLNYGSNIRDITVLPDRRFDLRKLGIGFDVNKSSAWSGGDVDGYILTVEEGAGSVVSNGNLGEGDVTDSNLKPDANTDYVSYAYDCGNGQKVRFNLCVKVVEVAPGDADGDGKVGALDAALVLRRAAGIIGDDELQAAACDVDGDGKIGALDAALILRRAAGIINRFPVEG